MVRLILLFNFCETLPKLRFRVLHFWWMVKRCCLLTADEFRNTLWSRVHVCVCANTLSTVWQAFLLLFAKTFIRYNGNIATTTTWSEETTTTKNRNDYQISMEMWVIQLMCVCVVHSSLFIWRTDNQWTSNDAYITFHSILVHRVLNMVDGEQLVESSFVIFMLKIFVSIHFQRIGLNIGRGRQSCNIPLLSRQLFTIPWHFADNVDDDRQW